MALWVWISFTIFVLLMLVLDLGVFHRQERTMRFREAVLWSAFWLALALAFAILIHITMGKQRFLEFFTGYVIEQSLSVDNLFVFLVLFSFFKVAAEQQYRVLFWGILGAITFRLAFILAGVAAISRFHWVVYLLGAFLIYTGVSLFFHGGGTRVDPARNPVLRMLRKFVPITEQYEGGRFFLRRDGRLWATPLLAVLVIVETTDIIFAVDSIPAILAISQHSFIVFSSNVFAILGLRAMYFALAGVMNMFHYLNYGLAAILSFVGVKMLLSGEGAHFRSIPLHAQISTGMTLAIVGTVLAVSIATSLLFPPKSVHNPPSKEGISS